MNAKLLQHKQEMYRMTQICPPHLIWKHYDEQLQKKWAENVRFKQNTFGTYVTLT